MMKTRPGSEIGTAKTARPVTDLCDRVSKAIVAALLLAFTPLAQSGQAEGSPMVAIVSGSPIFQDDLDSQFDLQQQIFEIKTNVLQRMISDKLLEMAAGKRGLSVENYLHNEIDAKIAAPSDGELHGFYLAQRDHYQKPFESVRDEVIRDLHDLEVQQARKDFAEKLRAEARVVVLLEAPRVSIDAGDSPRRGAEQAAVTITEFGDYQCPFCRGVQATLHEVREKYGDKVSFVFKDYPLREIHPQAQDAAEAGSCAREQGNFWEFHDAMFASPSLTPAALEGLARKYSLDVDQFEQCLSSHKFASHIDADRELGAKMGMSGTPAFNINGVVLTGAQPLAEFERVIDQELVHQRR
jgi:protein-disulfide isomerase